MYHTVGNFCEVYILLFSQFDQICESLCYKFVNIIIQTYNTSMQITKLIPQNVCLSTKSRNFMPQFFTLTVHNMYVHMFIVCTVAITTYVRIDIHA